MNIIKSLKSFIDILLFTSWRLDKKQGIMLFFSLGAILMKIVIPHSTSTGIILVLGIIFLVFSIYRFLRDLLKTKSLKISYDRRIKNLIKDLKPSLEEEKNSYESVVNKSRLGEVFTYSKEINRKLRNNEIQPQIVESYEKQSQLKQCLDENKDAFVQIIRRQWWLSLLQGKIFINEKKIGLSSSILSNSSELTIFKTDYFTSFLTNGLLTCRVTLEANGKASEFYNSVKDFFIDVEGIKRTRNLDEYIGIGHIGVSSIAITKDKYMCLWTQSTKAQHSEELLAPTGSGSLDWSDFKRNKQQNTMNVLYDTVNEGMRRELIEECNRKLRAKIFRREHIEKSLVLGFFRNLKRAGKPDFVGICYLNVGHLMLKPSWEGIEDEGYVKSRYEVKTFEDLNKSVNGLLEEKDNLSILSIPLYANLIALKDFLDEYPDGVKKFVKYE